MIFKKKAGDLSSCYRRVICSTNKTIHIFLIHPIFRDFFVSPLIISYSVFQYNEFSPFMQRKLQKAVSLSPKGNSLFTRHYELKNTSLLTFTPECRALCLPALASRASGNSDVLCMTDTVLIKGTILSLTGYICFLCGIIYGALIIALSSFPEAAAAGILRMLGIVTLHLNIILAAALFLVIHAACYGTI